MDKKSKKEYLKERERVRSIREEDAMKAAHRKVFMDCGECMDEVV